MAHPNLSDREKQLLELAAKGFTDQAISNQLGISIPTISTYWGRIRAKMGPHSRPELVATFIGESVQATVENLRRENEALQSKLRAQRIPVIAELIQQAPEAVMFVDRTGAILMGNQAAAELFGCNVEMFPQLRVGAFIPNELHDRHRQLRESFFATGGKTRMGDHEGVEARKLDGTPLRILASVSTVETEKGLVAVVFAREAPPEPPGKLSA